MRINTDFFCFYPRKSAKSAFYPLFSDGLLTLRPRHDGSYRKPDADSDEDRCEEIQRRCLKKNESDTDADQCCCTNDPCAPTIHSVLLFVVVHEPSF